MKDALSPGELFSLRPRDARRATYPGVAATQRGSTAYSLFTPVHYEPGYAYPLLVWLDGSGGSARTLHAVVPQISLRNFVAVAPRGPMAARCIGALDEAAARERDAATAISWAEDRVLECIDVACATRNVRADAIFVAGRNAGGTLALRIAWRHPWQFAGAVNLFGSLPQGNAPLSRLRDARRVPVFWASSADRRGACEQQQRRLLFTAGIDVTHCDSVGQHGESTGLYDEVNRWLMRQACGDRAVC